MNSSLTDFLRNALAGGDDERARDLIVLGVSKKSTLGRAKYTLDKLFDRLESVVVSRVSETRAEATSSRVPTRAAAVERSSVFGSSSPTGNAFSGGTGGVGSVVGAALAAAWYAKNSAADFASRAVAYVGAKLDEAKSTVGEAAHRATVWVTSSVTGAVAAWKQGAYTLGEYAKSGLGALGHVAYVAADATVRGVEEGYSALKSRAVPLPSSSTAIPESLAAQTREAVARLWEQTSSTVHDWLWGVLGVFNTTGEVGGGRGEGSSAGVGSARDGTQTQAGPFGSSLGTRRGVPSSSATPEERPTAGWDAAPPPSTPPSQLQHTPNSGYRGSAFERGPDLTPQSPQDYQNSVGSNLDASRLPAGMRNNNPGNLKYSGSDWQRDNLPGLVGPSKNTDQGDPQAVFSSPRAGMQSMARLLLAKDSNGLNTVNSLIADAKGWTPGNYAAAANIAKYAGVDPNARLNMKDPAVLARVMRAIIKQEQGQPGDTYTDDLIRSGARGALGIKEDVKDKPRDAKSMPSAMPAMMGGDVRGDSMFGAPKKYDIRKPDGSGFATSEDKVEPAKPSSKYGADEAGADSPAPGVSQSVDEDKPTGMDKKRRRAMMMNTDSGLYVISHQDALA